MYQGKFFPFIYKFFNTLSNNLSGCNLVVEGSGANTKYYIQKGADSASKKLLVSGATIITKTAKAPNARTQVISFADIPNYNNLTVDNFAIVTCNINSTTGFTAAPYLSYDAANGNVTINSKSDYANILGNTTLVCFY